MSSLLQVPWAQQLIGPEKKVAIITSDAQLTDEHLTAVGISLDFFFYVFDIYYIFYRILFFMVCFSFKEICIIFNLTGINKYNMIN